MIIFSHKFGQLGNRLFAYAHLIANARANQHRLVNLAFDEYAQYFENTKHNLFCRYPQSKSAIPVNRLRSLLFILNKGIIKLLRAVSFNNSFFHEVVVADLPEYQFQRGQYCDLNAPFIQVAFKRKNVLLFGRFFRDYRNLEKYQDEIRDFFRPTTAIRQNVSQFLLLARQNAELLVGIHIRRGDYEQFISGKYFFSQEDYLRKMRELLTTGDRRTIAFVICSNEWVNPAVFKGLNFVIGPGHVVKDMYALAGCDFIMGPPSTYTRWASFYGKTPLLQLESLAQQVSFSQFLTLPPERLFDF